MYSNRLRRQCFVNGGIRRRGAVLVEDSRKAGRIGVIEGDGKARSVGDIYIRSGQGYRLTAEPVKSNLLRVTSLFEPARATKRGAGNGQYGEMVL